MTNTTKPGSRLLFTPSTLPQPSAPDPVVAFIEDALLAIANRQDKPQIPVPLPDEDERGPEAESAPSEPAAPPL